MNENYLVIKVISRFHYLQICRPTFARIALKKHEALKQHFDEVCFQIE